MKVLVVGQAEVPALLPMNECMDIMAQALAALARGQALMPLRSIMWLPERVGALGMMPAYAGDQGVMGLKVISVFPGNHGTEFDSHQGAVMLFETKNGRPLAIVDATSVTAIRTAAVSGIATRLLAREDAGDLAILGSGTQARVHLDAMRLARRIRRVRVWSRNPEHAAAFARREGNRHSIAIEPVSTAARAVQGADLICTTMSATEPVLRGEWIAPGAHINAVGSSVPFARELDTAAVVRARLFVDRRESTLNEAGDFLFPKKEGAVGNDHIQGEIGELLIGQVQGRRSPGEVTLFKSLGLAIEDVASAHHIYAKALNQGLGVLVELGGSREETLMPGGDLKGTAGQPHREHPFEVIQPEGMYRTPSYAHAIRAGNTLYIAGQVARDERGNVVAPGDAAAQARQVYANLGRVLNAAGADWSHIVKMTTYLVDRADAAAVSAVRFEHLGDHRPPHTGLIVAGLGSPDLRVEVDVIAVLPV